jgi:microcystin-dependent protein
MFLRLFLFLVFSTTASAIDRQRSNAKEFPFLAGFENYVKNPSCLKNTRNIGDAGGALSRNTSSPLTQEADCQLDNTVGNAVKWEIDPLPNILDGQDCELRITYTGTGASIWSLEFEVDGTDVLSNNDLLDTAAGKTKIMALNYPCPVGSTNFVELDGSGAIPAGNTNIAHVYFGPATNIGSVDNPLIAGVFNRLTAQSIPNTTDTVITFNNVVDSTGDLSLNTSTGVVTIGTSGWYVLQGQAQLGGISDQDVVVAKVQVNGSDVAYGNAYASVTAGLVGQAYKPIRLNSGDEVRLVVFHDSGTKSTVPASDRTFLSIHSLETGSEQVVRIGQTADVMGTVFYAATSECPANSLLADGSEVSRSTYAALFNVIGTTFGVGDGSTTFNLPNMEGVFVRGTGTQTINTRAKGGDALGDVSEDQMQKLEGRAVSSDSTGSATGIWSTTTGVFDGANNVSRRFTATNTGGSYPRSLDFDSSLSPDARASSTTDGETYPSNIAMTPCIWNAHTPMPLVKNAETSDYDGVIGNVYAKISNSGGTPSVDWHSGWVDSLTDNGAGDVIINHTSNMFSDWSKVGCLVTVNDSGDINGKTTDQINSTTVRVITQTTTTGADIDKDFSIHCWGPK